MPITLLVLKSWIEMEVTSKLIEKSNDLVSLLLNNKFNKNSRV